MIDSAFTDSLNAIRLAVVESIRDIERAESFASLIEATQQAREQFDEIRRMMTAKIDTPYVGRFVVAVVGSSGHGKTTIMDEMFPSLSGRGWLETDVTDTTSQALRIEYAESASAELKHVCVNSWTLEQIKSLFQEPEVMRLNESNEVRVVYGENSVEIDGREAQFEKAEIKGFKFPRLLSLHPFQMPYAVPGDRLVDKEFIRALTVKQPSNKINAAPILRVGDYAYNSLELRAVVKDVTLKDDFANVKRWLNVANEDLGNLIFVDTPGVGVSGSIKDEVLIHALEAKSRQIVLELLKNDELDIVVHLVLCGQQSDFSSLWKALEREGGAGEMSDLAERTLLAINGTNILFSNKDIRRHIDAGDHFEITIEDNILQKMSPRGRFKPAALCFMDSKRIIENGGLFGRSYDKTYEAYRNEMEKWLAIGSKPHDYLARNGWVDSFRENIAALLDPNDRGQGYLIRQIAELARSKGKRLLVKKYLVRSGLAKLCVNVKAFLGRYYGEDGVLNAHATEEAIASLFAFLEPHDAQSIERFCREQIDQNLQELVKQQNGDDWVLRSFEGACMLLYEKIVTQASVGTEIVDVFWRTYETSVQNWAELWGYTRSDLISSRDTRGRTAILLCHSLATHVREILHQFMSRSKLSGSVASIPQSEADKQCIVRIQKQVDDALASARQMCQAEGVEI